MLTVLSQISHRLANSKSLLGVEHYFIHLATNSCFNGTKAAIIAILKSKKSQCAVSRVVYNELT